jgi:O-antigen ligase
VVRASLDIFLTKFALPLGGSLNVSMGVLLNVIIIGVAVYALLQKTSSRVPLFFQVPWFLFLASAALGVVISPTKGEAIKAFLNYCTYFSSFVIGYFFCFRRADPIKVRSVIFLSCLFPIFFTPIQMLFFPYVTHRAMSTFTHPNILAFYLFIVLSYFFHLLIVAFDSRRRFEFSVAAVLLVLGCACLLLTETRSAWIAFGLFIGVYAAIVKPKLLIPIVMLAGLMSLLPVIQDRIAQVAQTQEVPIDLNYAVAIAYGHVRGVLSLDSYSWRKLLWQSSWPWIDRSPIIGYGLNSFAYYVPNFFPLTEEGGNAHNIYIQLLFELGYIGLITYILVNLTPLYFIFTRRSGFKREKAFAMLLILGVSLESYSDNMLYYLAVNMYFWFLIGAYCKFLSLNDNAVAAIAAPPGTGQVAEASN